MFKCYRPGPLHGCYPQQRETDFSPAEEYFIRHFRKFKQLLNTRKNRLRYIVKEVNRHERAVKNLSEGAMNDHIVQLKNRLRRFGLDEGLIALSFATIREVSERTLGKRHFDVQLFGGWIMINGMIAEMATGEGKTLCATLASCTAALAGIPVHVITSNDYLAERDGQLLEPLYRQFGLTVGSIVDGMEAQKRQQIYRRDIVHSTSQQITFDYLRDRIEMGDNTGNLQIQFDKIYQQQQGRDKFLLPGLCFAIVDEADSVLIDEARTPLIISETRPNDEPDEVYRDALNLAESLNRSTDFIVDRTHNEITLTKHAKTHLQTKAESLSDHWQSTRRRENLVVQALTANHLFHRDKHYLVRDGKVQIIDSNSGRVMADRAWEMGLHQLIETKEACKLTGRREPLARISYQRFFRRYLRLGGMSGTVQEVADELWNSYLLRVVRVPTHRPLKRKQMRDRVYRCEQQKSQALLRQVNKMHRQGRPVLIGTASVEQSDQVSQLLTESSINHQVLNARQDQEEAKIIAAAGEIGAITVATNMAGRGTDIPLNEAVVTLGGLHVIALARNDARRIDRQLFGRCARQGDPGSAELILSIEDKNIALFFPRAILQLLAAISQKEKPLPYFMGKVLASLPQKRIERMHRQARKQLSKIEAQLKNTLAFSGQLE